MIRYLLVLCCFFTLGSCKKVKEKVEEKLAMNFITSGKWKVTQFTKGDSTLTADFDAYQFQFKDNRSVDALKNGSVEKTGTWDGNQDDGTITSYFTNTGRPLLLLNGVWLIKDGSPYGTPFVLATQLVNGETETLRLEKL